MEGKSATALWCESGGTCGAKCDGTEACVCVCVRCAKGAVSQCDVCMRALRVSCPSLSVPVVVAIEATPSCIDHGVRAIEALGR